MFGKSTTSRPLTALVTLMALGLGGCAHDGGLNGDWDLIGSIMAILDGASPPPSDSPGSPSPDPDQPQVVVNLVERQAESFSLVAGGALQVTDKSDGALETFVFANFEGAGPAVMSISDFVRNDQAGETGLHIFFDWGMPEIPESETEKLVSFDEAFGSMDLDLDQTAPFTSYSRDGKRFSVVEPGDEILGLEFATFGSWSSDTVDSLNTGFFFSGVSTETEFMPATGAASYAGLTIGSVIDGDSNRSSLTGDMALAVDFSNGAVDGDFTSMMKTSADGATAPWRDFTMTASINAGTDSFSGTTATNDGLLSGAAEGAFFGPNAAEVAGAWTLSGDGETALGSFGGGQN